MAKQTKQAMPSFPAKWIAAGVVVLIILVLISMVWGAYNNFVRLNQNVDGSWANVETQYQRRVDLIPNLVNVVQSYAGFERSTLTQVTTLRTQWMSQQGNPEAQAQTTNQIESALKTIFAVAENYPDLKANTQFTSLQDNLAETENMVMVSRTRYNDAVREYNTAIQLFPANVFAGWFGFSQRTYFQAAAGAENAPTVNITIP